MTLKKLGGIAALIEAATYIFGFALLTTVLAEAGLGDNGQLDQLLAFMVENQGLMSLWTFSIYIVNGIFLVVLVVALHDLLKEGGSALNAIGAAFGLIWAGLVIASGMVSNVALEDMAAVYDVDPAAAQAMWLVISSVQDGLGGGNEIVGGLWILLISLAALHSQKLGKALNWLGIAIGIAGIMSALPPLGEIGGAVFGLGFILWFLWAGVALLQGKAA